MNGHGKTGKLFFTPLLAGVLSLAPAPAKAQNVVLDEGTFTVFLEGRQAGTETFSIRRMGSGEDAKILANAVVELDTRQMRPLLEATPEFGLTAYEVKISGDESVEVAVRNTGRRFVARVRSAEGEQEREFRAREGAVLLEDRVAHQYWFVVSLANEVGDSAPVVVPRGSDQGRLEVLAVADEVVRVGGQAIEGRRLRLAVDGAERTVWIDREGRILRVDIPSMGYRAERLQPPA